MKHVYIRASGTTVERSMSARLCHVLIDRMQHLDLLTNFDFDEELPRVLELCDVVVYENGAKLIQQGRRNEDWMFLLLHGTVDILVGDPEHIKLSITAPDYVGEGALREKSKRSASIRAKGEVQALRISREKVIALFGIFGGEDRAHTLNGFGRMLKRIHIASIEEVIAVQAREVARKKKLDDLGAFLTRGRRVASHLHAQHDHALEVERVAEREIEEARRGVVHRDPSPRLPSQVPSPRDLREPSPHDLRDSLSLPSPRSSRGDPSPRDLHHHHHRHHLKLGGGGADSPAPSSPRGAPAGSVQQRARAISFAEANITAASSSQQRMSPPHLHELADDPHHRSAFAAAAAAAGAVPPSAGPGEKAPSQIYRRRRRSSVGVFSSFPVSMAPHAADFTLGLGCGVQFGAVAATAAVDGETFHLKHLNETVLERALRASRGALTDASPHHAMRHAAAILVGGATALHRYGLAHHHSHRAGSEHLATESRATHATQMLQHIELRVAQLENCEKSMRKLVGAMREKALESKHQRSALEATQRQRDQLRAERDEERAKGRSLAAKNAKLHAEIDAMHEQLRLQRETEMIMQEELAAARKSEVALNLELVAARQRAMDRESDRDAEIKHLAQQLRVGLRAGQMVAQERTELEKQRVRIVAAEEHSASRTAELDTAQAAIEAAAGHTSAINSLRARNTISSAARLERRIHARIGDISATTAASPAGYYPPRPVWRSRTAGELSNPAAAFAVAAAAQDPRAHLYAMGQQQQFSRGAMKYDDDATMYRETPFNQTRLDANAPLQRPRLVAPPPRLSRDVATPPPKRPGGGDPANYGYYSQQQAW